MEMSDKAELKDRLRYALDLREKKAADLSRDLKIPKSAVSQYLSGTRTPQDSKRLYAMANYLNVDEAWLLGYDVPMEREVMQKNNDTITDVVLRMTKDSDFFELVEKLQGLDSEQIASVKQMLSALLK